VRVSQHKWRVLVFPHTCYAITYIRFAPGKNGRYVAYLHRFILGLGKGRKPEVDHKNHNGLDCRRSNMRVCTSGQNKQNSRYRGKSKSGYRGVFSSGKRWYASIQIDGKRYDSERFDDVLDAARAYDRMALEHHGEYAVLNLPDEQMERAA
jgi:hypothetical protein